MVETFEAGYSCTASYSTACSDYSRCTEQALALHVALSLQTVEARVEEGVANLVAFWCFAPMQCANLGIHPCNLANRPTASAPGSW